MRIDLRSVGLVVACLLISLPAGAVEWGADLDEALARARAENRLVLVQCHSDASVPCREMDVRTWANAEVARLAERFIRVRMEPEARGGMNTRRFEIEEVPALLALDGEGSPLLRVQGPRSAIDMAALLRALPERLSEADSLVALAKRPPDEVEACVALANRIERRGLLEACSWIYRRLFNTTGVQADSAAIERVSILLASSSVQRSPASALNVLDDVMRHNPRGHYRREALAAMVQALYTAGDKPGAGPYLQKLRREFPRDSVTRATEKYVLARR